MAINVTETNDASNTVPTTPVSATEGVGTAISGIAISDPDASGNVTTTLSVLNGALTVANNVVGGLSSAGIGGNGSGSVTLTGTVAQINATLAASNGLLYLEQGDHTTDTLTVATQDQGTAPLLTATNTVAINVTEAQRRQQHGADHTGECDRGRRHGDRRHRDQRSGRQRQRHDDAVGAQWRADGGEQCGGRAKQRRHRRQWQRLGHPDRHGGADQRDASRQQRPRLTWSRATTPPTR